MTKYFDMGKNLKQNELVEFTKINSHELQEIMTFIIDHNFPSNTIELRSKNDCVTININHESK